MDIVDQVSWFIAITLLISQNVRIFISLASGSVLARLQYITVACPDSADRDDHNLEPPGSKQVREHESILHF